MAIFQIDGKNRAAFRWIKGTVYAMICAYSG